MITIEKALETLERFNIDEQQLNTWEAEFDLDVPVDALGNKLYNLHHINLFKNVKKHLTLGRSLEEIKKLVILPPKQNQAQVEAKSFAQHQPVAEEMQSHLLPNPETSLRSVESTPSPEFSKPRPEPSGGTLYERALEAVRPQVELSKETSSLAVPHPSFEDSTVLVGIKRTKRPLKRYATSPVSLSVQAANNQPGPNAGLVVLVDRLMNEKDDLLLEVTQIEKQNTHLLQVNAMFQRRLKELNAEIEQFQTQLKSHQNLKLIDDKARLQKRLLEAEQRHSESDKQLKQLHTELQHLRNALAGKLNPKTFVGNWLEEAELLELVFDNFGINIENRRNRMFKITHPPERSFGATAVIENTYDYQTNTLWKRTETLMLSIVQENQLEGMLIVEYTLDGASVAKALYQVKCHRTTGHSSAPKA